MHGIRPKRHVNRWAFARSRLYCHLRITSLVIDIGVLLLIVMCVILVHLRSFRMPVSFPLYCFICVIVICVLLFHLRVTDCHWRITILVMNAFLVADYQQYCVWCRGLWRLLE